MIVGLAAHLPGPLHDGLVAHGGVPDADAMRVSHLPQLISGPFASALDVALTFALVACLVSAVASAQRGGRYHYADEGARKAAVEGEAIEPVPAGIAPALMPQESNR